MSCVVQAETPPVEVYQHLGCHRLKPKVNAAARAGLACTWHVVIAYRDDHPVGMGRVIGDGGTASQIVDMCVLPECQGRGLGKVVWPHHRGVALAP